MQGPPEGPSEGPPDKKRRVEVSEPKGKYYSESLLAEFQYCIIRCKSDNKALALPPKLVQLINYYYILDLLDEYKRNHILLQWDCYWDVLNKEMARNLVVQSPYNKWLGEQISHLIIALFQCSDDWVDFGDGDDGDCFPPDPTNPNPNKHHVDVGEIAADTGRTITISFRMFKSIHFFDWVLNPNDKLTAKTICDVFLPFFHELRRQCMHNDRAARRAYRGCLLTYFCKDFTLTKIDAPRGNVTND